MAYTTVALVRAATGMSDATKIPDSYLTTRIAYADGLINSYIGKVYTLPLASTPDMVAMLSLEITISLVFIDQFGEEVGDSDKGWNKRLSFWIKLLEGIAKQSIAFFGSDGAEMARSTLLQPSYYPTDASSDPEATDSTAPEVKRSTKW